MTGLAVELGGLRVEIDECDLDTDADIALEEAYAELDAEERRRAASFVFDRDRDRYVRAHGRLRRRLGAALGFAPEAVPIAVSEGGKPFVPDHRTRFNLSHSGARAVIAITEGGEIGVDLELLDRGDGLEGQLDDLARSCLTPTERNALAGLPTEKRVPRFLSYWTAKEARMKLTGEGLMLEPQDISLELSDGRPVGYRRPHAPGAELLFVPLSHPDAICCLAVRRDLRTPGGLG
ncbi:MAG TPA: 4'-phosphopantetheinyl transferase superfamily protein [Phenylobacterium sp.]|nr:4'-phosphopantetheinyl transferase superfamily protein [Phenylobacterium sp.]